MARALVAVMVACAVAGCVQDERPIVAPPTSTTITDAVVARAAALFRDGNPSEEDLVWLEAFTPQQRQEIINRLPDPEDPDGLVDEAAGDVPLDGPELLGWYGEWIERRRGGGRGCYAAGFWNSSGQCGNDWPPDKVFYFPCSDQRARGRMRIWSTDWRSRWALGSGVSARVYRSNVQVCIGYWALVRTYTNPYTMMRTTYIYW